MPEQPWWMTDSYTIGTALPDEIAQASGPRNVALVRAFLNGSTDKGWGLNPTNKSPGFMKAYMSNRFRSDTVLYGFHSGRWGFAIVMRSVRLVCIDIDGKNEGFVGARKLGMLPHTLAETSKSGTGYHLFYSIPSDTWDPDKGFAMVGDRIGFEQGVDLRGTGCVYHYKQQRWNDREIAPLPQHLLDTLLMQKQRAAQQVQDIEILLNSGDDTEVLLMQDTLVSDLRKPIHPGKRNNTLFAIGTKMKLAQVPNWGQLVHDRALEVGLDIEEADKLLNNITKYGGA